MLFVVLSENKQTNHLFIINTKKAFVAVAKELNNKKDNNKTTSFSLFRNEMLLLGRY